MEENRARDLLETERAEVLNLLAGAEEAGREDRETEDEQGQEDVSDAAQPLTAQGQDDAIAESLRDRLAKLDRALKRLDDGTLRAFGPQRRADPRRAPGGRPRGRAHGGGGARIGRSVRALNSV